MVYGNYDPAYIQPVCDLCGEILEKRHEYLPFKIELAKPQRSARLSEHEGHICNSCNELEKEYPFHSATNEVEFHYMGDGPAELVMVEVLGTYRTGGSYHAIHKYKPDNTPEFLRAVGAAVLECRNWDGAEYDSELVDELTPRVADVIRETSVLDSSE